MRRIIIMILSNLLIAPYYFYKIYKYGKDDTISDIDKFMLLKSVTQKANKGGRVKIEVHGEENIPQKSGYIMYPNHQGLYDVLAFFDVHPHPMSVIMKKEVENIPFLKDVFKCIRAKAIDREDMRQSMKVIIEVVKEVKEGRNYIIFPEGTRSKNGNELMDFKNGSFKSAVNAKCPIVPVALIDSYKPFDTKSIKKITVKLIYLKPLLYDEYKNMKTVDIANIVKKNIEETIYKYSENQ